MSDDAFDLDITDQLRHDVVVARLRDSGNTEVVTDQQKAVGFSRVPKPAKNWLFVKPR